MIQSVFVENFKAIHKAASFPLQPFTVFIGNNGTGKSSILEALKLLQDAVNTNLDEAFRNWGGIDKIRNYNAVLSKQEITEKGFKKNINPVIISLTALVNQKKYEYQVHINNSLEGDFYVVEHEELICNGTPVFIADVVSNKGDSVAYVYDSHYYSSDEPYKFKGDSLMLAFKGSPVLSSGITEFCDYVENWQFLYLNAHDMGKPVLQSRIYRNIRLDYDGRNIAEYILWLKNQGQEYLDNLIRKMSFVLPYISDLQPNIQDTFNREVELLLHEKNENSKPLPGWLLSSGTLRILALLSMFETPDKPSVLFVDEIENGLDPRTVGLLISLIESEYRSKEMQVIATTHSPYFLDLVPLESIIVSEKNNEGSFYHIPKDEESLNKWKEKFSPGKLYSMGKLTK